MEDGSAKDRIDRSQRSPLSLRLIDPTDSETIPIVVKDGHGVPMWRP